MIYYKITCVFQADWNNLVAAIFPNAQHSYSRIGDAGQNVAIYGFSTAQTPVDLGSLVKVEIIPTLK